MNHEYSMPTMAPLRPHDVAVALQLALRPGMFYRALAGTVGLSQGATHNVVKRLAAARLVRPDTRAVHLGALLEFVVGGVPDAFAAELGPETRGVATAHAGPPLVAEFSDAAPVVWPALDGSHRGATVEPLYGGAPSTMHRNPPLYELLTLVDALRVGRVRERLLRTARRLEPLLFDVVFVGGQLVELLVSEPAAIRPRPTDDVRRRGGSGGHTRRVPPAAGTAA
jgi:hypothetical protein